MADDTPPIAEQVKWDVVSAIQYHDGTAFGYSILGDDWVAIEYNDNGEEIARYKLTLKVEGIL